MRKRHSAKAMTLPKSLHILSFFLVTAAFPEGRSESRNWVASDVLVKECSDASILCNGYIRGLVDAELVLAETLGRKPFFCLPDEVNVADLRSVVIAHYERNPREGKNVAARAILIAFTRAYPCR